MNGKDEYEIKNLVRVCNEEIRKNESDVIASNDASLIANSICILSCSDRKAAESLFKEFSEVIEAGTNQKILSYYLLSAKELGYNARDRDIKSAIDQLENERCGGKWSDQVWLNSLVLKALGRFGITYPKMVDYLIEQRLSNGSWFEKVWVTSYALEGLFYSHSESSDLTPTATYLKNAVETDHWGGEERGKMSEAKVTSRALQSLLLIGEGYEEEPLSSALEWSMKEIKETSNLYKLITLSMPLAFIVKGRAQKQTSYRKADPVEFRETKVEIGEKIEGDKVDGDLVEGDKVDEKVGTKVKDSAVVRSEIDGGGETDVEDSVAMKSDIGDEGEGTEIDNSVVMKSDVGGGKKEDSIIRRIAEEEESLTLNYSVFTGQEIDGEVKYCPKCGTKVKSEWKCCVECGYKMEEIRKIFG